MSIWIEKNWILIDFFWVQRTIKVRLNYLRIIIDIAMMPQYSLYLKIYILNLSIFGYSSLLNNNKVFQITLFTPLEVFFVLSPFFCIISSVTNKYVLVDCLLNQSIIFTSQWSATWTLQSWIAMTQCLIFTFSLKPLRSLQCLQQQNTNNRKWDLRNVLLHFSLPPSSIEAVDR